MEEIFKMVVARPKKNQKSIMIINVDTVISNGELREWNKKASVYLVGDIKACIE